MHTPSQDMCIVYLIFSYYKSAVEAQVILLLLLLSLKACGLHNQVITYEYLLKDKFACFTSFANEGHSCIAGNPIYGSVTKIKTS